MCTLVLTNDLIDCGQLRAKPRLCKVKPKHVLKNSKPLSRSSPWLTQEYTLALSGPKILNLILPTYHKENL